MIIINNIRRIEQLNPRKINLFRIMLKLVNHLLHPLLLQL